MKTHLETALGRLLFENCAFTADNVALRAALKAKDEEIAKLKGLLRQAEVAISAAEAREAGEALLAEPPAPEAPSCEPKGSGV